jgi:hypothetical protein
MFAAHEDMCKKNVLRRDISWNNVMCEPVRHSLPEDVVADASQANIRSIL